MLLYQACAIDWRSAAQRRAAESLAAQLRAPQAGALVPQGLVILVQPYRNSPRDLDLGGLGLCLQRRSAFYGQGKLAIGTKRLLRERSAC